MGILAPLAFLFALALPAIVALYLLKLRRQRRDVPSTMLWRRAADDLHANAPFQRLRRNLLLLLQLLAAAALVMALVRPTLRLSGGNARSSVLLMDVSASMGATDEEGGKSRLNAAKEAALERISQMGSSDQAMLAVFADRPTVVVQFTGDKSRLASAVKAVEPTHLPTRPREAVTLAESLARPANSRIVLFTDGAFSTAGLSLSAATDMELVKVGQSSENTGIVGLDLRRAPGNPSSFEVFADIRHFGSRPVTGRLDVLASGKLIDAREVKLEPGGQSVMILSGAKVGEGRLELQLAVPDALDADNRAYAVTGKPPERKILLVSAGNYFLERVLQFSGSRGLATEKVLPSAYNPSMRADLVIFDGTSPEPPLGPGAYLFINALPPVEGYEPRPAERNGSPFDWDTRHPVMRYVELSDTAFGVVAGAALPAAANMIAETRENPLISVYSADNRHAVVWHFDLYQSNLPLRAAFPILVENTLEYLLRHATAESGAAVRTGDLIEIPSPRDFRRGAVTGPDGTEWPVQPDDLERLVFDRTTDAGFYTFLVNGTQGGEAGVSLIDPAESDIMPADEIAFETGAVAARAGSPAGERQTEVWRWAALAALAFVLLEWLIYHRRIWV